MRILKSPPTAINERPIAPDPNLKYSVPTTISQALGPRHTGTCRERRSRMPYQKRRMYDVSHLNLTCADCGAEIKELPFEPKDDRPVYCRECARKRRPQNNRIFR